MPLAGTTLQGSEVILEHPPGLTPSELPVTANRPLSVWKAVDVCDRRPGSANTCSFALNSGLFPGKFHL